MTAYSDYCNAEKAEGRKPLPPKEWSAERRKIEAAGDDHSAEAVSSFARHDVDMLQEVVRTDPPVPSSEGVAPQPGPNDHDNDPEDEAPMPHEDAAVVERLQARLEGEDPLAKAARLRAEAAALEAQVLGVTPEDQKEIREKKAAEQGRWIFHTDSRFLSIVLETSGPYKENGHHYPGFHKEATFSYGNYVTSDAKTAELLMATRDYQRGVIWLVDEAIQQAVVGISDGPRTSSTLSPRVRARPAGALSAPLD